MKGTFITKEESYIIKAIAVMLMVYHHLFGFPDRISVDYTILIDFPQIHIGTIFAYWGRFCIAIFAFVSGYGMTKILANDSDRTFVRGYQLTWKTLKSFYLRYWMVCVFFLSYGLVIGSIRMSLPNFIQTLLGGGTMYNAEWWYITNFVFFCCIFPIIFFIVIKMSHKQYLGFICLVSSLFLIYYYNKEDIHNITFLLCFAWGMYCVQENVFERMYEWIKKLRCKNGIAFISLILIFIVRLRLSTTVKYDFLFVAPFIFNTLVLFKSKKIPQKILNIFMIIGKYSTYIWLTHTFFAYYYWQKYLYSLKYSLLIFVVCLLLCVSVGIVLEKMIGTLKHININVFKGVKKCIEDK